MFVLKFKIGYHTVEFIYTDWEECSLVIKSLLQHNSNVDLTVEVSISDGEQGKDPETQIINPE